MREQTIGLRKRLSSGFANIGFRRSNPDALSRLCVQAGFWLLIAACIIAFIEMIGHHVFDMEERIYFIPYIVLMILGSSSGIAAALLKRSEKIRNGAKTNILETARKNQEKSRFIRKITSSVYGVSRLSRELTSPISAISEVASIVELLSLGKTDLDLDAIRKRGKEADGSEEILEALLETLAPLLQEAEDLALIWSQVFGECFTCPSMYDKDRIAKISQMTENSDIEIYIDTYYAGVPAEDIVAGMEI